MEYVKGNQSMMIVQAINFAAEKHKGQVRRESGLPYFTHTVIVMELIQKYKGCSKNIEELKCAALLHDVLEDTECDFKELEREFGPMVASIVLELTSDEVVIAEMGKNEYLKQKMLKMSRDAFILKLLDRMSNCLDNPTERYKHKTLDMIKFLQENRPELTERQSNIMNEIRAICLEGVDDDEE